MAEEMCAGIIYEHTCGRENDNWVYAETDLNLKENTISFINTLCESIEDHITKLRFKKLQRMNLMSNLRSDNAALRDVVSNLRREKNDKKN